MLHRLSGLLLVVLAATSATSGVVTWEHVLRGEGRLETLQPSMLRGANVLLQAE